MGRRLGRTRLHREDLSAKGLDVSLGDKLPAPAVHHIQLLAPLVIVVRVGVGLAEEALQLPVGGLIPQLPVSGGGLTVGSPFLAGPQAWRRAILGGLLAPSAYALREFLDLAALGGAVVGVRVDRARATVSILLARALATSFLAPGRCCSDRGSRLRPPVATVLVLLFAATLGNGTGATLLGGPVLWG